MDWFERITGFRESGYAQTQARLGVQDGRLLADGRDTGFAIGDLELVRLGTLRERAAATATLPRGRLQVDHLTGDIRRIHERTANAGALFQVASQFNLLEMIGPGVTPEHGVTGYASDRTQGPACAMAAGAGTIYRNYLVPVAGQTGQTADRQLDTLAGLGAALGNDAGALWTMRNGYAMSSVAQLQRVDAALAGRTDAELDALRALIEVGVQWDVRVTEPGALHSVTQVYCSALPVAYCDAPTQSWARFATLVLEGAYEATLLAGALNLARTGNPLVYLTRLGGGAFGNAAEWIDAALQRALERAAGWPLQVRLVSYGRETDEE